MDNTHELQSHIQSARERMSELIYFKRLMDDQYFQKFILGGYCHDQLVDLVRVRAVTTDINTLNMIDRRIDSVGQFQHYLKQLQQEFANVQQSLADSTELINTNSTEDQ